MGSALRWTDTSLEAGPTVTALPGVDNIYHIYRISYLSLPQILVEGDGVARVVHRHQARHTLGLHTTGVA